MRRCRRFHTVTLITLSNDEDILDMFHEELFVLNHNVFMTGCKLSEGSLVTLKILSKGPIRNLPDQF